MFTSVRKFPLVLPSIFPLLVFIHFNIKCNRYFSVWVHVFDLFMKLHSHHCSVGAFFNFECIANATIFNEPVRAFFLFIFFWRLVNGCQHERMKKVKLNGRKCWPQIDRSKRWIFLLFCVQLFYSFQRSRAKTILFVVVVFHSRSSESSRQGHYIFIERNGQQ